MSKLPLPALAGLVRLALGIAYSRAMESGLSLSRKTTACPTLDMSITKAVDQSRLSSTAQTRSKVRALIFRCLLFAIALLPGLCRADSAFVPVFIDARTEAKLGPFPYDRAVLASAMTAFEKLGAKGVVMKFFLDQAKSNGDSALAAAMAKLPTVLQARCDDTEARPNALDARFSSVANLKMQFAVSCKSGWIPLPVLQSTAADVCFIDQSVPDTAPIHERYQGRAVKSLYTCALALAGKSATSTGLTSAPWMDLYEAPRIDVISLIDVLDGKTERGKIAGKVVVFGYEGPKAPMFDTAIGRHSAHRLFMVNLLVLEQ